MYRDQGHSAEFLEFDIAIQGGEQVVSDGGFAAHLKILDVIPTAPQISAVIPDR